MSQRPADLRGRRRGRVLYISWAGHHERSACFHLLHRPRLINEGQFMKKIVLSRIMRLQLCFNAEPNRTKHLFKGIFQPFELGGVTRLITSAVKFSKAGHLKKKILMIQSHERSLKEISGA